MTQFDPFSEDALSRPVPRYTSYPTAPHFHEGIDEGAYRRWLGDMDPETALSLYIHIPFCDRLCWFCACRTQGTTTYKPVASYLGPLGDEIDMVARATPAGGNVGQIHLGGGSPSILAPEDIGRVVRMLSDAFPGAARGGLEVELDPRGMTEEKLDAFVAAGLTR
ncbi:MAG: radical SAM protein, partial [Pseudomonadota bacterium]